MRKLCCIGLSLATRIICTYTMSLSVLMINVLMSNFFSRTTDDHFFDSAASWSMFGLNWMQILRSSSQVTRKAESALVFFLLYVVSFLLASGYLALGSISRRPKCAVPWMYLQMISIIDQTAALSIHLTHGPRHDVYDKPIWYMPASSVYLLVSAYFWLIVHAARRQWADEQPTSDDIDLRETATMQPSNASEPKSPSFVSQNFSMFQSPRPPTILPK